jgi:cellulose synthase/poly-beta-1,6-N-acetylglucosamine synthase-like glycosyltransferase
MAESRPRALPSCTVVICTRDRPSELEACLAAVSRLRYPGLRTLVVDSASAGNRTREAAERFGAEYLRTDTPGLSYARNLGARACATDIVAFTDDDAVPEPDWVLELARGFDDPRVAAVTGLVAPVSVETDGERLYAATDPWQDKTEFQAFDRSMEDWFQLANFGRIGTGNNMAFRRSVFDSWPGFDVRLGRGAPINAAEEMRAFSQLIEQGHRVVYTPRAIIRHPYPRTMEALRAHSIDALRALAGYSALLFVEETRYRSTVLRLALRWFYRRRFHPLIRQPSVLISKRRAIPAILSGIGSCVRALRARPVAGPLEHPKDASDVLPSKTST